MGSKMSIKRLLFLLTVFIIFFSFNMNVKAATAGKCIYCGYTSGQSCNVYVKLTQSKDGKITYKYKTKELINTKLEEK